MDSLILVIIGAISSLIAVVFYNKSKKAKIEKLAAENRAELTVIDGKLDKKIADKIAKEKAYEEAKATYKELLKKLNDDRADSSSDNDSQG